MRATPKGDAAGVYAFALMLKQPIITYVQAIIHSRPMGPLMTLDSSMMNLSIFSCPVYGGMLFAQFGECYRVIHLQCSGLLVQQLYAPLGDGSQVAIGAPTFERPLGDTDIGRAFNVLGYAYAVPLYFQVDVTILDVYIDSLYHYAFDSVQFHGVVLLLVGGGGYPPRWGLLAETWIVCCTHSAVVSIDVPCRVIDVNIEPLGSEEPE